MKDSLSSFLPNMPGLIDAAGSADNSSLKGIIEKPPGETVFIRPRKQFIYLKT